jgi:hypothetical protein
MEAHKKSVLATTASIETLSHPQPESLFQWQDGAESPQDSSQLSRTTYFKK